MPDLNTAVLAGRHVLIIGAARGGKTQTLAQLLNELVPRHLHPHSVVALTVARSSAVPLQEAVTPLVEVNTLYEMAQRATASCELRRRGDVLFQREQFAAVYLEDVRQVNAMGDSRADRQFLREVEQHVQSALRIDARARLADVDVLEQWLDEPKELPPGFVQEVSERYQQYKSERRLRDATDLLRTPERDPEVRLVAVDDAEDLTWGHMQFLARAYPQATFVFAGNPEVATRYWDDLIPLQSLPHDQVVHVAHAEAPAETWTIEAATAGADIVPAECVSANHDLLIILGERSQRACGRWAGWCKRAGFGYRVEGWRGWRAEGEPLAHITSVERSKGRSADVVVIDGFTMRPRPGLTPDMSRARWTLACSRARHRLVILQHETNAKLRLPDSDASR